MVCHCSKQFLHKEAVNHIVYSRMQHSYPEENYSWHKHKNKQQAELVLTHTIKSPTEQTKSKVNLPQCHKNSCGKKSTIFNKNILVIHPPAVFVRRYTVSRKTFQLAACDDHHTEMLIIFKTCKLLCFTSIRLSYAYSMTKCIGKISLLNSKRLLKKNCKNNPSGIFLALFVEYLIPNDYIDIL